jgi:putative transposase
LEFDQSEKEIGPMKRRFTEGQIIGFLREADAGLSVKELCRKHGFSAPSYYAWKARFGGMKVRQFERDTGHSMDAGLIRRADGVMMPRDASNTTTST